MSDALDTPLNEDELAELDGFLLSDACDDDVLSVDEAHGYLTAIIVSDEVLEADELLDAIWGSPRFPDEATAVRMTEYMQRLYNDIAFTLDNNQPFEPLAVEVEEDGVDVVAYEGWCYGFMLAVDDNQTQWDEMPKDEQALLAPIAQLALLNNEEEPDMEEDEYNAWVELLPGAVMGLYSYWHQ